MHELWVQYYFFSVVVIGFNPTEYNVSEGAGAISLMIERRGAIAQPVTVNISTNNFISTGIDNHTH